MHTTNGSFITKIFTFAIALLGWFALIAQFLIFLQSRTGSIAETIIRFFSYFTILANFLVTFACTIFLINKNSATARFFKRAFCFTALTVYIIVVGSVFNIVLRPIWHISGLQVPVNELLHTIIPSLTVVYWLCFIPEKKLPWSAFLYWLPFPLLYGICIFIRGYFSGFYPYPFINISVIGYPAALWNVAALTVAFVGLSLFLIALARLLSRKKKHTI